MPIRSRPEYRCSYCQALLAKHERDGLAIRRGGMQALVTGTDATVAVTCYRCKTLQVVTLRRPPPPATKSERD